MRRFGLGLALGLAVFCVQAQSSLQTRQSQAQQDRAALREQIDVLRKRIESSESARQDASAALKDSEQAISDISRRLHDLEQRHQALDASLQRLQAARQQQGAEFERQRQALADQLRAQYASGLSPWTALLSGRDPQDIGRELTYLAYVSRARADVLQTLQGMVVRLADLQQQTDASQAELETLQAETQTEKQSLQDQQAQHRQVLAQVQARLKDDQRQATDLQARDARLGGLIESLEKEIAQVEIRRQAALKAEAERLAKERAEQARRAQIEKARREQAAKEAADRAAAEQAAASQANDQARQDRAQAQAREANKEAKEAQEAKEVQEAKAAQAAAAQSASEAEIPEQGFAGLKKNLPRPVAGETQGRFGAQRPDGGLWRGVVLRAAAGAPVRTVAPGRVVYASWLAGFGNLLIVDHGQQYLSVYGYNQVLLKQVGDIVRQGDVVAQVGATGGQVDPGLYFELRHQGAPINPQLWLKP
ncbi:murein hydrolase activator EnvC family protein [Castellaniella sp.]|uniref:murein hydrolase activator EnvC family protein n=1 Tax=Castellaniella sp. TaxID=1955812 RepID=UPI002AFED69B|nr:peptidoglycan DD-metalloendopeptidase family protein [Castellaniella sp.]